MQATVDISRVYLNEDGRGVLTCRHCDLQHPIDLSPRLPESVDRALVKARCMHCASIFYVRFDCRRYPRIPVHLLGTLVRRHSQVVVRPVEIISLSLLGIGFILPHDLPITIGEVFDLQFVLDDEGHSVMQEAIIIRRTNGPCIGAEFSDHDTYKYALDFYLSAHGGTLD